MKKEKLLLINPKNDNGIVYFPLGIAYAAAACVKDGIDVECIDLNVTKLKHDRVIEKIIKDNVEVIGIGGFALQIKETITLANEIKDHCPGVTVMIGGVQVHGCERFLMENSKADIVCIGEAELTLPRLVHIAYADKDYSVEKSIVYRKDGEIIFHDDYVYADNLDEVPFPAYDLFDIEAYVRRNYHSAPGKRTLDFICSRGCPYKCNYCINSKKPVKMRYRSPENILKEIRFLKENYQIDDFSFCDEIFMINKKKALEICEAIKGEKISWVTSTRADDIDDFIVSEMKDAGCRMLLIGFESGSDSILKSMNKRASVDVYSAAIRLLRKHDLPFYANFMTGMPEETEDTLKETECFCTQNALIYGSVFVTPFPGTQLYDDYKHKIADEKKYIFSLSELNFAKEPVLNLTGMGTNELVRLRNETVINTISSIILNKVPFAPEAVIKIFCRLYMFFFSIKTPIISEMMHWLTKLVYKIFSVKK